MEENFKSDGTYIAKRYLDGVLQTINVETKNGSIVKTLFGQNSLKIYEKIEKPNGEIIITRYKNGIRAYEKYKSKNAIMWKYSVYDKTGRIKNSQIIEF